MNKVVFNYTNNLIEIQCNPEDLMKKIFQKFEQKTRKNYKDLFFYYNGSLINEELKLAQIENSLDKERKIINVLVYDKESDKKSKNIERAKEVICPNCRENARIEIKNLKFSLFDCINNHKKSNLSIDEFTKSQNIDTSEIICDMCNKNTLSESFNKKFYYCLFCKSKLCVLCNSIHDESHKIVKYEQKNYYCQQHFSNYIKYCKQCKKNMCIQCEKEHKNHNTLFFGDILVEKEKYIQEMNFLRKLIEKLNEEINNIINLLMNASENINNYYKIANDIIKNYNIENLNYNLLKNINEFSECNNTIKN